MKKKEDLTFEIVREVVGPEVLPLVKVLRKSKNLSEFKLADLTKQEINITRHLLYKLYDVNLVSFMRKKDKKKGWYIYYWTFNERRVNELSATVLSQKLDKLKERLVREQSSQFYMCKNKCMRLDFDQSSDFSFKCPECGELLDVVDNSNLVSEIQKNICELESRLAPKKVKVKKISKKKRKR